MKTAIGVYNTHAEAVNALKELQNAGYPTKNVSILGKVNEEDVNRDSFTSNEKVAGAEVGSTVLLGSTLGILTGIGVFAIPGFGFLYGAGALIGAIAGFDIGLLGGGVISALTLSGVKDDHSKEYETAIKSGKFLLIAQGSEEEVNRAKDILHSHGTHSTLAAH